MTDELAQQMGIDALMNTGGDDEDCDEDYDEDYDDDGEVEKGSQVRS